MRRSIRIPATRLASAGARIAPTIAWAVLLLVAGPISPPVSSPAHSGMIPAVNGACLGSAVPNPALGTLVLDGNSTPLPSVVGVSVQVDYFYTEVVHAGNTTTYSCIPTVAHGTTTAGGNFSVTLAIPTNSCPPNNVCKLYSGPYGPLGFATPGPPAGFVEQDPTGGGSPGTIHWDANLSEAQINVTGTVVVSTGAPVPFSASASSALGTPAPGALAYNWSLAGLEWGISSQRGPNVTVVGTDSGWTGSLSVTVSAQYGPTTESVQSPVTSLVPVATRLLSAIASPSPVDPGVPVTFDLTGSGAAGYSYSATVDPGLDAGSATGACASSRSPNGTANLTCQVQAVYPAAGTAFPTATISNGYSSAQFSLSAVAVHPVEEVTLSAPSLVTYPNRTIALTVNVTNGTGSAPYGPACLSVSGLPGLVCQFQNATTWVFDIRFTTVGQYELRASVVDRFGQNVTSSAVAVVVPLLTARANGSSSLILYANQTTALSVIVTGGALPLITWWNLSGSSGTVCWGVLASDGIISCPFPTSQPGHANLTVTLRDSLGSEATVLFRLTVTQPPVRSGPTGGSVFSGMSGWILFGLVTALGVGGLLVAWDVRRRRTSAPEPLPPRVEENELERMARGRDHLLAQADPGTPRRPDELIAGWTGPPVAPEEWAEWIAALVTDGSLLPSRARDHRLVYRRAAPHPSVPTIQFDPTVLDGARRPPPPGAEPPEESPEPQDGG